MATAIGLRDHGSMQHPIRARMKDLHRMLNEWDFIGVGEFSAHDDEYDCLLGPLLTKLASGANVEEVARFLREKIASHFGLDSGRVDVAGFAVNTVAWWQGEQSR
jgi:hypothetical protein